MKATGYKLPSLGDQGLLALHWVPLGKRPVDRTVFQGIVPTIWMGVVDHVAECAPLGLMQGISRQALGCRIHVGALLALFHQEMATVALSRTAFSCLRASSLSSSFIVSGCGLSGVGVVEDIS